MKIARTSWSQTLILESGFSSATGTLLAAAEPVWVIIPLQGHPAARHPTLQRRAPLVPEAVRRGGLNEQTVYRSDHADRTIFSGIT